MGRFSNNNSNKDNNGNSNSSSSNNNNHKKCGRNNNHNRNCNFYYRCSAATLLLYNINSNSTTGTNNYQLYRLCCCFCCAIVVAIVVVSAADTDSIGRTRNTTITALLSLLYVCSFVGCLTSQQQASISQGRICSDNCTCCHTEIQVADPTFYLTQSQYTDTGPTSPSAVSITPGAWQGSHWSTNL